MVIYCPRHLPQKIVKYFIQFQDLGKTHRSSNVRFESQLRILDGHFFTLICCKNSNVCWKKTENKRKRGGGWPSFVNNNKYLLWMLRFNALLSKALNLRVCIQAILSKIIGKQSNRAKDR